MDTSNHSDKELRALRCSLLREEMRIRRLYGRYLELKKCDPGLNFEFFEVYWRCQRDTFHKDIPGDQMRQDMINELAKIMSDLFMFMSKYERLRIEHPEFKINFVEAIKSKHIIMN